MTIRELIEEQRTMVRSSNPAERLAAALLIPNLLRERLRSLPDCEIGQLLEHEVCSNLGVLAPELTVAVCDVCGHRWIPETANPPNCPSKKCRLTLWDKGGIDGRTRGARIKVGRSRRTTASKDR